MTRSAARTHQAKSRNFALALAASAALTACGGGPDKDPPTPGAGQTSSGGEGSSNGGTGGGATGKGGGMSMNGGAKNAGGASARGGETSSNGGASSGKGGSSSTSGGAKNSGGTSSTSGGASATSGGATTTGGTTPTGPVTAAGIATRLGRKPNFLIGMGNDLNNDHNKDGAYTLGVTLDLHYAYLVGLKGEGGWPDWNSNGTFVNILTDTAKAHGVTPMFTLYAMAARGENNLSVLQDKAYMQPYWDSVKLMYERIAVFDGPAAVNFEPDFWGYLQQGSKSDPASVAVSVTDTAPDCAGLSNNITGLGKCLVVLGRKYAPKAVIGFHVSGWADGDPKAIVKFMLAIGAGDADIVTTDTLDRDAGCFEAGTDPNCARGGTFYWDETNKTSPNFHEHLAWVKTITTGIGRPMLWWQTPFGVPSDMPGGTAGKYRDNRVRYIFSHIQEFIDAGGVGAAFGTGAGNQTYIDSDGDQFKNAVAKYLAAPVALP